MNTLNPKTMQPSDFEINKTWLAYRINSAPINVDHKEVDLYVLQDAASMFLFGNAFAAAGTDFPGIKEVEKLLHSAYSKRGEWPTELLLPGNPGNDNSFAKAAHRHGVKVRGVPESRLSLYIKDTQEAYEDYLWRSEGDA